MSFYLENRFLTDVDVKSGIGDTPMHFAARANMPEAIDFLFKRGADLNAPGAHGWTPLHLAVLASALRSVEQLLDLGAEQTPDARGMMPISHALRDQDNKGRDKKDQEDPIIKCLRSRLKQGRALSPTQSLYPKVLMAELERSIRQRDLEECMETQRHGCPLDIDVPSCSGCTPLMLAVRKKWEAGVRWLLREGALATKPACRIHGESSVIEKAVQSHTLNAVLPALLDKYLDDGGSWFDPAANPLCNALNYGNVAAVALILQHVRDHSSRYA
ncbi:ankyrin [Thozetella sp. PMI_491]|nr:ankyrin [Thozetella sp. PMI_491]